jgi:hypothetical protein
MGDLILTNPFLLLLGDVLDDYPDSPVGDGGLSREAASHLLDSEDAMEASSNLASGSGGVYGSGTTGGIKRSLDSNQRHQCPSEGRGPKIGPSLPPIYYSVLHKKLAKMTVRHLDGGAFKDDDSTNLGASVNAQTQIGSFNNPNVKRHNHTVHRHDHLALRNISTSFDPVPFTCKSCPGAHQVLRRTVEGSDVGLDNPPVFVLTDQNFPPMAPAGGEGECLKIILVENSSLTDLVDVFLGMSRGFDMPAGTVVLLASPSHAATIGTADYASELVRASGKLRGFNVLHGIPFLLGGIQNTPAIRTIAEVEQWVTCTDDILATRKSFMASLRTSEHKQQHQHIMRLPASQFSSEKLPFGSVGFDNLKTAVDPLGEELEKALISLLIDELNNLYPVNLCTDIICDRFMEDDVFSGDTMDRTDLVLIGASHLSNVVKHVRHEAWVGVGCRAGGQNIHSGSELG